MYQIYTFPACEKCSKLKQELNRRGISYEEINAGSAEGRVKLRDFTKQYHKQLKKDEKGWMILPLVVDTGNGTEIFQGENCLEKILTENENSENTS